MRADRLLVEKGLAPSRARAQELIEAGRVFIKQGTQAQLVKKASALIPPDLVESIYLEASAGGPEYVSRGGLKMQGALRQTGFDPRGAHVLDIGISTGGFTDCLLQSGAEAVVGIDVGHGQLVNRLAMDERVTLLEGVNARNLGTPEMQERILRLNGDRAFNLIVIDVSFISLSLVLPGLIQYLWESAPVLALVKPQFEVGRSGLGKNGIVKDTALYRGVEGKIRETCGLAGLMVEDYFESSIEGSDGNREFFVYARRAP